MHVGCACETMPAQAPVMAAPSMTAPVVQSLRPVISFPLYAFTYVPGKMLEKANKYITATIAWNIIYMPVDCKCYYYS